MDKPNVIVIMSDQLKAKALSVYGNTFCETPSIERLANEGVLYKNAFTPHPLCVPARVSLWASQFPHTHGARRNETFMPPEAIHAFKIWKKEGFRTGLIGKNHCFKEQEDLDLFDVWCEIEHAGLPKDAKTRGMDWVRPIESINKAHEIRRNMPERSPRIFTATSNYPLEDYSTSLVANQTVRFLEENRDKPFALWVSFPDPHAPYEVPEKYKAMFPPERIKLPPRVDGEFEHAPERNQVLYKMLGMEEDSIEDVYDVIGTYYAMVRFLDDELGRIFDALEKLELSKNTIVVFCADHGDFSGEHGMTAKGGVFYDCLTHIPLIVSWPGNIKAGQVDESMVNLMDVVPTLLKLQHLEIPRSMQGELLPTITEAEPRDAAFSEYGAGGPPFRLADLEDYPKPYGRRTLIGTLKWREAEGRRKMVRTHEWKYIHDPMGDKDELYDLVNDPLELRNVVEDDKNKGILAELRLRLLDWSIKTEDSRPVPLP